MAASQQQIRLDAVSACNRHSAPWEASPGGSHLAVRTRAWQAGETQALLQPAFSCTYFPSNQEMQDEGVILLCWQTQSTLVKNSEVFRGWAACAV